MTRARRKCVGLALAGLVCAAANDRVCSPIGPILGSSLLVLYLPGAALVAACDPWARTYRNAQRAYWSIVGSIMITVGAGFMLNFTAALTRWNWLALLVIEILFGSGVGWVRSVPSSALSGYHAVGRRESAASSGKNVRMSVPLRKKLWIVVGGLLVVSALLLSEHTATTSGRERFVQLWLLPSPVTAGAYATEAEVGVTNYEGRRSVFEVRLFHRQAGDGREWRVFLNEGESWKRYVRRSDGVSLIATVHFASSPKRVLARVALASPAS